MQLFNFLNYRKLGKIKNNNLDSSYWKPNLDHLLSRLACHKDEVYFSYGEGGFVPPFACKFRKDSYKDLLAVANEEGEVSLIDTGDNEGVIKTFTAHHNAIFDICWLPDKSHLITASGDHTASLWDVNTCQRIKAFKTHTESLKSVDVCQSDTALIATASKDGSICLWDSRTFDKPTLSIKFAHFRTLVNQPKNKKNLVHNSSLSGVSALSFQNKNYLASAGNSDGVVKIWDLRKTYLSKLNQIPHPAYKMKYGSGNNAGHGITSLAFDSAYKRLYGCSTASKIFAFDCHTYTDSVCSYDGFKCKTYFVKMALSADDQYLLCGSSDFKAYVWKTSKPGSPILELPGHSCEVTAVAWGPDITKLVTCGDDNKILVWKIISDQNSELQPDLFASSNVIQSSKLEKTKQNILQSPTHYQNSNTMNSKNISPESDHPREIFSPNLTPNHPRACRTPVMKSITSFFQPITASAAILSPEILSQGISATTAKVLSPSKIFNQNISLEEHQLKLNSPKKRLLLFKENQKSSGQMKRKSPPCSNSNHSRSIKKLKRNSPNPPRRKNEESITNYFQRTLI